MNKRKLALSKELHYGYKVAKACDRVLAKDGKRRRCYKGVRLTFQRLCFEAEFHALAKEIKQRVRSRPNSVTYVLNEKEVTVEHDLNHLLFWLG
jgi:hypothetical protein